MQTINLPQVRLAQLQTLTESVIGITQPLTEVAAQVQNVTEAFTAFQEGMTKTTSASNKKTLDRTRDLINSGLFKSVEAEQFYPHDADEAKTAVSHVVACVNKYGYELNRLSYDEQTAETDNMVTELEALDLSTLPAVERWIALIKSANESFKLTTKAYLQQQTQAGDTEAASKAAVPLENALNELFTILHAHVLITKTDALINAHKELTTLVNSYR